MKRRSLALILAIFAGGLVAQDKEPARREDATAAASFEEMVKVFHHPRCMNCHSRGGFPRQGDDEHQHSMNVRRGPNGDGVSGANCSSCHHNQNSAGPHTPPGAPDWHLPSAQMPMIWEGLTDRQLCQLFKDPAQNGGRSVQDIVEHLKTPLVAWGWNPGEGRAAVPVPQQEFLRAAQRWVDAGAACPAADTP